MKIKTTKYSIYYKEIQHEEKSTTIYHIVFETFNNFEFMIKINYLLNDKSAKVVHVDACTVDIEPRDPILTYRELKKEVYTND